MTKGYTDKITYRQKLTDKSIDNQIVHRDNPTQTATHIEKTYTQSKVHTDIISRKAPQTQSNIVKVYTT